MIKKAQIKFICITMSLLLCVFGVIFGASYYILDGVMNRNIERALDDVEKNYNSNNGTVQNSCIVVVATKNSQGQFDKEMHLGNEPTFSQTAVDNVVSIALSRSYKSGAVGTIYYKVVIEENTYFVYASDMSQSTALLGTNLLKVGTFLAFVFLAMGVIVVLLSFSVFKPVKEAFYKQKQFISNASHELKTPLTIISANAEVLKQNGDNPWVDNINSQTERLEFLVNDMLSLAKIDEGKTPLSSVEFNLSEVVINDVLPFDAVAFEKNKTLNLFVKPDITYKGDIISVKKIVNILIDNAIKHADSGGEINVYLKKENGKISLTVFNTGSNVPEHSANKIFERFYRGEESRSRNSGGSGLGLAIAKSIADANKWKLSAQSKLNEYMSITVQF